VHCSRRAPTSLEVKTLDGEIKELEFTWAGFGSRPSSIIDVAAVLYDPKHAEQELRNSEQLADNVSVVKRGTMKQNVTVVDVKGRRADALNGLYEDTGDFYNGKHLFRKRNDPARASAWLSSTRKSGLWVFSTTASKDANSYNFDSGVWVFSTQLGKGHPTHVNDWEIYANKRANELWVKHMKCISSQSTNFVEKAQRAEKAGACALIVINS
jgi:hypothetical protein